MCSYRTRVAWKPCVTPPTTYVPTTSPRACDAERARGGRTRTSIGVKPASVANEAVERERRVAEHADDVTTRVHIPGARGDASGTMNIVVSPLARSIT
jgi:hypothetical protein